MPDPNSHPSVSKLIHISRPDTLHSVLSLDSGDSEREPVESDAWDQQQLYGLF